MTRFQNNHGTLSLNTSKISHHYIHVASLTGKLYAQATPLYLLYYNYDSRYQIDIN